MEKRKKTNRLEGNRKHILYWAVSLVLIIIISLSSVNGLIQKSFISDSKYGVITLKDSGSSLVDYSLTSLDSSILNVYAEGTATIYQAGKLFVGESFKDINGKLTSIKSLSYYIEDTRTIKWDEQTYTESCNTDLKNGSKTCEMIEDKIITHERTETYWKPYNFETLNTIGTYKWRIEGVRAYPNQKVDFILKSGYGDKELTEWAWWDNNWGYKKQITGELNAYYITTINVSYNSYIDPQFRDLRFTDSSETIELPYWIAYKNDSNFAEVRVLSNYNTSIYMYYGNTSTVTSNSNITQIYGNGLLAYYSFEDPYLPYRDDATGVINLTVGAGSTVRKTTPMGSGYYLTSAYLTQATTTFPQSSNARTMGGWINWTDPTNQAGVIAYGTSTVTRKAFEIITTGTTARTGIVTYGDDNSTMFATTQAKWYSTHMAYDGAGTLIRGYANKFNQNKSLGGALNTDNDDFFIGRYSHDPTTWVGEVDEVGVWNNALTAQEVVNIQNQIFLLNATFGSQEGLNTLVITQNAPANALTTANGSLQFSCNFTGTATNNVTKTMFNLYTSAGVMIQQTNNTGLNNISVNLTWNTNYELPDNNYLWACHAIGTVNNQSTTNRTLTIGGVFSICNATNTVKYLNLSFKDEGTGNKIDGRISLGSFVYYFSNASNNKSYSFINNSNNSEYNYCFSSASDNINVRSQVTYTLPGYTSRTNNINYYLSNSTNHTILYLLSDNDGNYFTFRVVDSADSPISNVYVEGKRYVGSDFITIVNGYTNDAGIINFWLEPDITHTFTFNKTGYPFTTYSLAPLCSASVDCPYTVTLGDVTTVTINSTARGISLSITPTAETLNNGTNYNFTMAINSSYWSLTNYGFLLRTNVTNYLGNTTGSLGTGQTLSLYNNTFNLNYTHIYLDWYYTTSQGTTTGTIVYYITNTDGYPFSIKHFFDDLKSFMKPSSGSGLFGASGISLDLLIFFVIVIIMGLLGYSTGLTDTASYSVILFVLIFLTDSVLGLFSIQQYMLTVMVGVISLILIYREVR